MPITPDRLSRLREFGLSEYASRAYLALLDLGVAEARDVSTLSKVPQAKIYHVLEQLHEKGLAVILPEFPKKYAPVPFPEYLDRINEEHTRAAQAIERDREILAEMFRVVGDTEVGNRGFFTVIRGRRNVVTKIHELVSDAKTDLLVVGTSGFALRHQNLLPELEEAQRRGVRLRGLIPLNADTLPKLEELVDVMEIRARDVQESTQASRVAIVIADGQRAFLINFLPDDDNLYAGKDIGVYTDQEAMVAALDSLVEPHWQAGVSIGARREELRTGRLAEFTRVHGSPSEADAALDEALARGASEVRSLDARAAPATAPLARIAQRDAAVRAIQNVDDFASAEVLAKLAREKPSLRARHLSPRLSSRYLVLDEREAFFWLAQRPLAGEDADEVVVHTSNAAVVRSLARHFDEAWTRALPLSQRVEELRVFPSVTPRELGMAALFDEVGEGIVVADASGRILLWNASAVAILGYPAEEALRLEVGDVFPDAVAAFLDAATGERQDAISAVAKRKDGARVEVELRLSPAQSTATHPRLALALVREGGAAKRVGVKGAEAIRPREP